MNSTLKSKQRVQPRLLLSPNDADTHVRHFIIDLDHCVFVCLDVVLSELSRISGVPVPPPRMALNDIERAQSEC